MTSRRSHRRSREPSPARAVAGWGGFSIVVGSVVLSVVEPAAWQRLLWLVPVGGLVVAAASAAVWAVPMRPLGPEEPPETHSQAVDDLW